MENKENLNLILKSFKIKAECCDYKKVRNVSLYDVRLNPGARVKDLEKFSNEIALSLRAKHRPLVKIISELGIVRLEIIDDNPEKILFFDEAAKLERPQGVLPMYLGSYIDGSDLWTDMAKNPHLLIAGCTGSGKSTLLHIIIANALSIPNTKICLIDSKNIEFQAYENKFNNVLLANNYDKSLSLLEFVYDEMEYRYSVMKEKSLSREEFPNIIFMIDEFADLIMQDSNRSFYYLLCKLAQKCRAAGIYCILATQRPSVDIISGTIKANFPARISCKVASGFDSKVILDTGGAELLAGSGDSIIHNYNNDYKRFQAAYTSPEEVCDHYAACI